MRKHLDDMVGERLAAGSVLLLPTILSWFVLSNYGVCYAYEGFSVFDCKAEAYMVPMFMQSRGVAIRSFGAAAADEKHDFLSTPRIIPFSSLVSLMRLLVSFLCIIRLFRLVRRRN